MMSKLMLSPILKLGTKSKKLMMLSATMAAVIGVGAAVSLPRAQAENGPGPYFGARAGVFFNLPGADRDDVIQVRHHDRDPHLVRALQLLQDAKWNLQQADTDSQGFRVKAIEEANEAIGDTQSAMRRDR